MEQKCFALIAFTRKLNQASFPNQLPHVIKPLKNGSFRVKIKTLTILFLLLPLLINAQIVNESPKTGLSTSPYVQITKTELTDTATVLSMHIYYTPGYWINIPKGTYIQPVNGNEKLFITATKGIGLDERYTMPESGEVKFSLVFPAIDKSVTKIDFGEECEGCNWFIYDIHVQPGLDKSMMPQTLLGTWYNQANGELEFIFSDTLAIYKNKVWSYDGVSIKKNEGSIILKNENESVFIYTKSGKKGLQLFGPSVKSLSNFSKESPRLVKRVNDKPYQLPVFKTDSAVYSGFFQNYTPRAGVKTMSVHINDIIAGNQNTYLININSNGYFSAKLPVYHPQFVYVRSPFYNGLVFIEPGKELFQLIAPGKGPDGIKFMGDLGTLNSELASLDNLNSIDYGAMQRTILNMTPEMFKTHYLEKQKKALRALDSIKASGSIGERAYQVKKLDITYYYYSFAMEYRMQFENAYRQQNNIPYTQRNLESGVEIPTAEYYDFLTSEIVNNELALLGSNYSSFINRLKYLDVSGYGNNMSLSTFDILNELEKDGYELSETEKVIQTSYREIEDWNKEFQEKYGNQQQSFNIKYQKTFEALVTPGKPISFEELVQKMADSGIEFTDDEIAYIDAVKVRNQSETSAKFNNLLSSYGETIRDIHTKYKDFISQWFAIQRGIKRNQLLQDGLGVQIGFASDIMTAQDYARSIVEEVTPVDESTLKRIQQLFKTPFIADYLAYCNNQTQLKIESLKNETGYVVNETPKTEGDLLFDKIMEKYKGKVVYVDFWATWCGPCRSGIEQIKPLKEEMADKDVVFVYITDQSSPLNTWQNMIPNIKGEHYRVSTDEWNYFSAKFNISGIPHIVLVGKNGNVVNPKVGHMENNSLKALLEKHLNE